MCKGIYILCIKVYPVSQDIADLSASKMSAEKNNFGKASVNRMQMHSASTYCATETT